MASTTHSPRHQDLEAVEIHSVLSNERRQMTIDLLIEEGGELSARELSERIAERETDQRPPPRNIRQSAYVSLLQNHLPKLDELDVIEYDDGQKTVRLSSGAEQLSPFRETDRQPNSDKQYLVIALVGLGIVAGTRAGLVPVDPGLALILTGLMFAIAAAVSAYRIVSGDRPSWLPTW